GARAGVRPPRDDGGRRGRRPASRLGAAGRRAGGAAGLRGRGLPRQGGEGEGKGGGGGAPGRESAPAGAVRVGGPCERGAAPGRRDGGSAGGNGARGQHGRGGGGGVCGRSSRHHPAALHGPLR
ncbi:hypothetical protein APUTEX25_003777, partial [Auxenochlorella protothecoides]